MKNIRKNIEKDLLIYVSWFLIVVLFWIWLFGILTRVKPEDKVSIFSGTYSTKFSKYDDINYQENRPEGIDVVAVNAYDVREDSFSAVLQVNGYGEADILILPKSQVNNHTYRFTPIPSEMEQKLVAGGFTMGAYLDNETCYGMKIYDADSRTSLIPWLCFEQDDSALAEDFYLLFNVDSLHITPADDIFTKDSAAYYVAIQLLKV